MSAVPDARWKTVHVSLSVRGAIKWPARMRKGLFLEDGQLVSAARAQEILLDHLAAGREVLPMGDCPGFDFKTGCPGHRAAESESSTTGEAER